MNRKTKMKQRTTRTLLAAGAGILTAGAVLAPTAALAAPTSSSPTSPQPVPTEQVAACQVSDATLEWGVIERWRSYIQGSIANGGWETEGNVTYALPQFVWSEGEGIVSVTADVGRVEFNGDVHFAGHGDLLQVNLGNPAFELIDSEEAYLLLDLESTDTEGNPDTQATQERAVKLEIAGTASSEDNQLTFTEVPGKLTAEGAAAFGGFYAAGEEIDPVTVHITLEEGCSLLGTSAVEPPATDETDTGETEEAPATTPNSDERSLTVPLIIGAAALVVIIAATIMLVTGRKKQAGTENEPGEEPSQPLE